MSNTKLKNNKNLKALVISNGEITNPDILLKILKGNYDFHENFLIICADGGVKNCMDLKLIPDFIIGDMDSIKTEDKNLLNSLGKNIDYITAVEEKNESDTQLAVEFAQEKGFKDIIVIGALGKRIDHSLANIFNIASPKFKNLNIRILDEDIEISVLNKSGNIKGSAGNIVSIFSLTPSTYFLKTDGLKYKLKNEKLLFSPVRGLSNKFTKDSAALDIKNGKILLVKQIIKKQI
ncbi:MAG TPA: thiamine diphosphokinase [Candidatus Hydromicrobium sp.]